MFRNSISSLATLSPNQVFFFTRHRTQRSSGNVKLRKLTPSFPSRDRNALTAARLLAGSIESPEHATSLALRLRAISPRGSVPASRCSAVSPRRHLWLLLPPDHSQSHLVKKGRRHLKRKIPLTTANSTCLSMTLRQEHSEKTACHSSGVILLKTKCRNQRSQLPV